MGTTVLIGRRRFLIGRTEETSGQKENKKTGKRVIFRDRGRRPASSLASGNNATRVSNGNQCEEKRQNTNWSRRASIPLPSACKADALPSELLPLFGRFVRAKSLGRNVFCLLPRLCAIRQHASFAVRRYIKVFRLAHTAVFLTAPTRTSADTIGGDATRERWPPRWLGSLPT